MSYTLKEFSKTEQYKKLAEEHSKAMIAISVLTSIISSIFSDIDVGLMRHVIVFFLWSLFGTSLLIALPSFLLISLTALKRSKLDDLGKSHGMYGLLKHLIYLFAILATVLSTLAALGRLSV